LCVPARAARCSKLRVRVVRPNAKSELRVAGFPTQELLQLSMPQQFREATLYLRVLGCASRPAAAATLLPPSTLNAGQLTYCIASVRRQSRASTSSPDSFWSAHMSASAHCQEVEADDEHYPSTACLTGCYCVRSYSINSFHSCRRMSVKSSLTVHVCITRSGSSCLQRCMRHAAPHRP
jgi:hypothetical protein